MALHRLTQIVMGVPNVEQTAAYYAEFGLTHGENGTFTTVDGGEQLRIVPAASRRLVRLAVGADDPDDRPPPPPSFLAPDDLAALMTGAHSPR